MKNKIITINLLTKEKIAYLREYLLLVTTHDFAAFSFVLISFISMILLVAHILLVNAFNDTMAQTTLVTKEYGGMNSIIRRTNLKLTTLNSIEREFTPWAVNLISFSKLVPKNVSLTTFSADRNSRGIIIRGVAITREDLLKFTKSLEESGLFENIESPISNLLTKSDLSFELNMKILESVIRPLK